MKPTGNGGQDDRRRRPIPWPRHVEIVALLAAASALLACFYLVFGGASEDFRRFAVGLGYEDSYVGNCKTGLANLV